MPPFQDLPNEILLQILQYLPPPDLGSFYCVDKHIYALTALHRIKYLRYKRRFNAPLNTNRAGSTARLIKNILNEPEAALYIKHWKIDGIRTAWGFVVEDGLSEGEDDDYQEHAPYKDEDLESAAEAMRNSEYIPKEDRKWWVDQMKHGHEQGLVALALTLMPNLASLDIRCPEDLDYYGRILQVIEYIANLSNKFPAGPMPLSDLVSVNVADLDYEDELIHPEFIEAFARLPSVRIINANRIGGTGDDLDVLKPLVASNVTDLNISESDIPPQRFIFMMEGFTALQSFTYWPTSDPDRAHNFDPFLITRGLLMSARDSLRELRLKANTAPQSYMGSLHPFRVLEYLDTDMTLLLGDKVNGSNLKLETSLPSSIREVKLCEERGQNAFTPNRSSAMYLRDLLESRWEFVPRLSRVEFAYYLMGRVDVMDLELLSEKVGVPLKLTSCGLVSLPTYTKRRGHYAQRKAKKELHQQSGV